LQAFASKIDYSEITGTARRFRIQGVDILSKKSLTSSILKTDMDYQMEIHIIYTVIK